MAGLTRREVLRAAGAAAGAGLLAGCTGQAGQHPAGARTGLVGPDDPGVRAAELVRRRPGGRQVPVSLRAEPGPVDLGGRTVHTWSYGGQVPAPEIQVRPGDRLTAMLDNRLPQPTTVHWHGLELYYPMDGVPAVTQPQIPSGGSFRYDYLVPDTPGTYWFHPHVGVQLDRGLYGPLVIEDPAEPLAYDHDWTIVLDDWIDGVTATPDQVLAALKQGRGGMGSASSPSPQMSSMPGMSASPSPAQTMGGMSGMSATSSPMDGMPGMGTTPSPSMGSTGGMGGAAGMAGTAAAGMMRRVMLTGSSSRLLGGDAGDVRYPFHVISGRTAGAPRTWTARPGQRARLRLINAGGDTAFRVALGGHRVTVVHADGYPVQPAHTDALLIGMGERYDVLVTLGDGAFPLTAKAEGKPGAAMAVIRTSPIAATPLPGTRPAELNGHVLGYAQLKPAGRAVLADRPVDRVIRMTLDGGMSPYSWTINGVPYRPGEIGYHLRDNERVRLVYANNTRMWHPMHLHGHAFALRDGRGPRKDTVIVLPRQAVTVQFDATNPGRWMTHCHNIYHAESSMMAVLGYLS